MGNVIQEYWADVFENARNFLATKEYIIGKPILWAAIEKVDEDGNQEYEGVLIRNYNATHYSIEGALILGNQWEHRGFQNGHAEAWKSFYGSYYINYEKKHIHSKQDALNALDKIITHLRR